MCIYSLKTGERTTKAKVGDKLVVTEYQHHAVLTSQGKLRCISHGSEMQVEVLRFNPLFVPKGTSVYQPSGEMVATKGILKWQGKPATVKLVRWQEHSRYASDAIELPDGIKVPLGWLDVGTTMVRMRKARKDKGVAKPRDLSKVLGLDQIKADIPVKPKRDDVVEVREHLRRRTVGAVKG